MAASRSRGSKVAPLSVCRDHERSDAAEPLEPSSRRASATDAGLPGLPRVLVGWLAPGSAAGRLLVDFPGNAGGPVTARATVSLDDASVLRAVTTRQGVTLAFENGDPKAPIVLGVIQEPASPFAALLRPEPSTAAPVRAEVDGQEVTLTAQRQIVLRCGEASITLRRDGRIVVRGSHVETHARGTNRIVGGQVKIN